ncbi:POTRA domain-containing protein [uncultured Acidaminococcus sp.]|uniref:POTRA domain-containing protein n=1 Tax=uncultured Acidaminococcus sp. TaxID=352152 RepID=UPI002942FCAD|nr:POTRA domain-containing protein [uncultured Acidaminococcus sp.]
MNGFKITGQDVIPEAELQPLLGDKKGRLLTFKDLQDGADTLTRYFQGKGYLVAHAYLPVQKINDGIVEYAVTVGSLDGFTINKPMANMRSTKATGLRRMLEPTRMTLRSAAAGSSMKMERPRPARTIMSPSKGTSSSTRWISTLTPRT